MKKCATHKGNAFHSNIYAYELNYTLLKIIRDCFKI